MIHFTKEDGLPSNNVYRVFQDTDGMLWFATDQGVSRYNGLKFENFTTEDGLPDNDIFYFKKDYEGRLWMAAYNGILVFYKDGIFHTAKNTQFLRGIKNNSHTKFMELQQDSSLIFFFNERSTEFLTIKKERVRVYKIPEYYRHISYVEKNGNDGFMIIQGYGDGFKGLSRKLLLNPNGKILAEYPVAFEDWTRWNSLYYFLNGRDLYDRKNGYIGQLPDSFSVNNHLNAVFKTPEHLFSCTNYGLWVDRKLILKDHRTSSVIQDQQGNYWITTLNNGVYKLSKEFAGSVVYESVYANNVSYSRQEKRSILFGTKNIGLYRLSDTGVHNFFNFSELKKSVQQTEDYNFFSYNNNDYLLTHNIAIKIRKESGYPIQMQNGNPLFHGTKNIIQKGDDFYTHNSTFISFFKGEIIFNRQRPKFIGGDSNTRKYQLLLAPDSSIWLTAANGIFKIKDTTVTLQKQFGNIVFRQMIFCKNFLAGIDPVNRLIITRNYNSKHALIDSSIKNSCIWIKFFPLTDSSVLVITNDYYRLITFGCNNPKGYRIEMLEYPFIPQLAEWIHADGKTCYFFKSGNITGIPIKDLLQLPVLPELRFTQIKGSEKTLTSDSLNRLDYNNSRSLSIYYTTLSFNTTDITFEYSVCKEGQPDQWTESNGHSIDLFNISHGNYVVKARVRTFSGRYNEAKMIHLIIAAPFWLSWWFITLVVGLTGLIVFAVVRVFAQRRLAQQERENKFLRSEFTALNALMNPHFVFNSLNSVQSLINKEDLDAANQYVRAISDLLRQNMHNISRELIPLSKEMELIYNYVKLEKLRFKQRLEYSITIAEDVEEEFILIPPLLIQPLVENAIKYTLAFSEISTGHVNINIYMSEDKVFIDVVDNGRGLSASKTLKKPGHESTALNNVRSRLEQLSQIHGKQYHLEIEEQKDEQGNITGICSRVQIEV